ncbi:MAG: SAM-dependent methyltransferase [Muribaculaceae bacterium]|nr:SAM-dependent methyltransferase [Muribaculaceae bacterium]
MIEPALYLIPVQLSECDLSQVLPPANLSLVREIRHFVVENVRSARRFLKKCSREIDIDSLTFYELNEHTRPEEVASMLTPLEQGMPVGIISEAGCPAIADPGADLVAVAQQRGLRVKPLVGPSSILMSLMASGFNGQSFAFVGYLPIDSSSRTRKLKEMEQRIMHDDQTQIFIETPYRNNSLLSDLLRHLSPSLRLCVASDITGANESIVTHTIKQWASLKPILEKVPTIFLIYK